MTAKEITVIEIIVIIILSAYLIAFVVASWITTITQSKSLLTR